MRAEQYEAEVEIAHHLFVMLCARQSTLIIQVRLWIQVLLLLQVLRQSTVVSPEGCLWILCKRSPWRKLKISSANAKIQGEQKIARMCCRRILLHYRQSQATNLLFNLRPDVSWFGKKWWRFQLELRSNQMELMLSLCKLTLRSRSLIFNWDNLDNWSQTLCLKTRSLIYRLCNDSPARFSIVAFPGTAPLAKFGTWTNSKNW